MGRFCTMLRSPTWRALAWPVLQVMQARPPSLTSGYPRQAQCCSFVNILSLIKSVTAIVIDFNVSWNALHTGVCIPIDNWQGANVKCRRHGMDNSVAEAGSHDEGRVEKSVTGVHGSTLFNNFQQRIVYSWAWECKYKLNDQPVRERVTAIIILILILRVSVCL